MNQTVEKLRGKKILWFTNAPSLYAEKVNGEAILGGWIPSLEKMFREADVELRLAFHFNVNQLTKDLYQSNTYYLIPGLYGNNKLERWKIRLLNQRINSALALKYYKEVIADFNPDIVQIWGSEQLFGLIIPSLTVPHILHFQGNLTAYHQKYYAGFSKFELSRAITIKDRLKREPFYFSEKNFVKEAAFEREIFKTCKNFFGRTAWDKRIVQVLSPKASYFNCNEILRDVFYNVNWKKTFNGSELNIVSVFRDSIYKGIEMVFDTAKYLQDSGVSFTWKLAGIDYDSVALRVLRRNSSYNIDKLPIRLTGLMQADDLVCLYEQSDLFVHPSHIDNSPNSVCEAMLSGIPVISTNVGGIPSLIKDNETGCLVQDGDSIALAGAIIEAAENYELAGKKALAAKQVAIKRHDKETIFNQVQTTYVKLIDNKHY